jgi:cytochrome c peroxidase
MSVNGRTSCATCHKQELAFTDGRAQSIATTGEAHPPQRHELTAPYMHDGSIPTLEGVIDHSAAGGRTIDSGPNAGEGHRNPNKDHLVGGFRLSPRDRAALIAFLECLTDEAALHDPRFANPW